ncbi:MAG: cysteine hydrolase [Clostridiaceae bacterium]|nr:cysteine hydrolase [Clostridiaceae bacterium]
MKKAIVVVDMQRDFVDGALGTQEAQAMLPRLLQKLKEEWEQGSFMIFTKDTHTADYLQTQEGKKLPVKHCIKGTAGWELVPELQRYADMGVLVVEKPSFGAVRLPEHLKDAKEIELVGLCTDICVISNALLLKAFFPETPIRVDASCCAGVTPETHKKALDAMRMCQIDVRE